MIIRLSFSILLTLLAQTAVARWNPEFLSPEKRIAEVNKCKKCHLAEYQGWKEGPHAIAYDRWLEHMDEVYAKDYHDPAVTKRIDSWDQDQCMRCHAPPQNIYEGKKGEWLLKWDQKGKFKKHKLISKKDNKPSSKLGVDCITCHRAGKRVVTRADYKPLAKDKRPKDKDFCDPLPLKSFSDIYNCASCHTAYDEFQYSYKKQNGKNYVKSEAKFPYQDCNSCHYSKKIGIDKAHYYPWDFKKDHLQLFRSKMAGRFKLSLAGEKQYTFTWDVSHVPHNVVGPTKMYVVRLELLGKKGRVLETDLVRIVSKETSDTMKEVKVMDQYGPVLVARAPNPLSTKIKTNKKISKGSKVRLTLLKKAQYYGDDKKALKEILVEELVL